MIGRGGSVSGGKRRELVGEEREESRGGKLR